VREHGVAGLDVPAAALAERIGGREWLGRTQWLGRRERRNPSDKPPR